MTCDHCFIASPVWAIQLSVLVVSPSTFAFWLSHVPLDHFESLWELVAGCVKPTGRIFFVDDACREPEELIEGAGSSTIQRCLNDGTAYRAVKVPHQPKQLEEHLTELGWRIGVVPITSGFYWGAGARARSERT